MGRSWITAALLAGLLTGCIVGIWPIRPLWTGGVVDGAGMQGFSYDNSQVITSHLPSEMMKFPYLMHWDIRTGVAVSKVTLEQFEPQQGYGCLIQLMDDRRTVSVSKFTVSRKGSAPPFRDLEEDEASEWCLVDVDTGKQIVGRVRGNAPLLTTSQDGRWWCRAHLLDPQKAEITLHNRSGELVHRWRQADGWNPADIRIAPDGHTAVVLMVDAGLGESRYSVSVVELPSCKVRREFELKIGGKGYKPRITKWDGRWLWLSEGLARYDLQNLRTEHVGIRADLGAEVVAVPEPAEELPSVFWEKNIDTNLRFFQSGEDWVAYIGERKRPDTAWDAILDRVSPTTRSTASENQHQGYAPIRSGSAIRIRDLNTGRFRSSLPELVRSPVMISPDGKYMVSSTGKGIAVWDADPVPRWIKAVAAGVLTAGIVLLFSRWRARRAAKHLPAGAATSA